MAYILQLLVSGFTEGSIYGLLGLGMAIIHRTSGILFFPIGTMAMVGGIAAYALSNYCNISTVLLIPIALMMSGVIGLASLRLVVLPLLDRNASLFSTSLATVGICLIFETVVGVLFGKEPLAVPPFSGDTPINFFGARIVPQGIWIVGTMVGFFLLFPLFFRKTLVGKAMTAVGNNSLLAKVLGIPVKRIFSYSFFLGALIGGLTGVVSAPISYTGYGIGIRFLVKSFIAAAIGGIDYPMGALLGGIIMGLFESFGAGFISSGSKDLITIILLLLVIQWRPQGLMAPRRLS